MESKETDKSTRHHGVDFLLYLYEVKFCMNET